MTTGKEEHAQITECAEASTVVTQPTMSATCWTYRDSIYWAGLGCWPRVLMWLTSDGAIVALSLIWCQLVSIR